METKTLTPEHPLYPEYREYCRWAPGPLASFRGWLVNREAITVHRERTGRGDPWPSLEDYAVASSRIPAE